MKKNTNTILLLFCIVWIWVLWLMGLESLIESENYIIALLWLGINTILTWASKDKLKNL